MNRLALVTALAAECDVNPLTTTIAQNGEGADMVRWVDEAWNLIQSQFKWSFLWEQPTLTVLNTTNLRAETIPHHRYQQDSCRLAVGAGRMQYVPWLNFDERFPASEIQPGTPSAWTIRPDNAFVVNAIMQADTGFVLQRYKNPIPMVADTDTPALAVEHHMMIVWRAMMYYAQHEEAGVIYRTGKRNYEEKLELLGLTDTPDWTFGAPLLIS